MKAGDRVNVPFANGTKEGVIARVHEKNIWVKVDFPRHPGKLIRRKLDQLEGQSSKKKARKSK
jgi:hypothetical protein